MNDVRTLKVDTPSDREIVLTREFAAPIDLVFDAWTKPELVKRWMLGPDGWTMPVCEIDLREGGRYRFVWKKGEVEMGLSGTYREVSPPHRLVSTELFDEDWTGGEALSTLELKHAAGRTTAVNTIRYASQAARDGALASGMTEGIVAGYDRLQAILTAELSA